MRIARPVGMAPDDEEMADVVADTGELVGWAATGSGAQWPPLDERFSAANAATHRREAGFRIEHTAVRPETFLRISEVE